MKLQGFRGIVIKKTDISMFCIRVHFVNTYVIVYLHMFNKCV